jgi:hypothetical protein
VSFIDEDPSAVAYQPIDRFAKYFEGLSVKKTTVHRFMMTESNLS